MLAKKIINLEVVGTCNLRCPSCPVGNYDNRWSGNTKGVISVPLFKDLLEKLSEEIGTKESVLALYSWGEPLIHPHIGELVSLAKEKGFKVNISTNLNYARNLDSIISAGVDEIVVSLSGFTNPVYQATHRGGDIETVKTNMRRMSQLIANSPNKPNVLVNYHLYRHNLQNEVLRMTAMSLELGFNMLYNIAFYMPVEKMVAIANNDFSAMPESTLAGLFLVPIEDQLAISVAKAPSTGCDLRDNRLDIDIDGSVKLCCSVFDKRWNPTSSYLDDPLKDIQAKRYASPLCLACINHRIDQIYTLRTLPEWQQYANRVFCAEGMDIGFVNGGLVRRKSAPNPSSQFRFY